MSDDTTRDAPTPPDPPATDGTSDNATLIGVLASLEAEGFGAQFVAEDDGRVTCASCGASVPAMQLEVRRSRRLEGASDPDDMLFVIGARCPSCSTDGTLILGYGPNADSADSAIASKLIVPADAADPA